MNNGMSRSDAGKIGYDRSKEKHKMRWQMLKDKYCKNPKKCKNCSKDLPYVKRFLLFCDRSCSAKYNNKGIRRHGQEPKDCLLCSKKLSNSKKMYCNNKCQWQYEWNKIKENIKNGRLIGIFLRSQILKRFCVEERGEKCEECGLSEWRNKKIPLNVHHVNGDAKNNRPENIQLLCLNCHGLTENYGRLNKNCTRDYRYKK